MMKQFFIYLFLILLSSCGFVEEEHITGNYYAIAIDDYDDRTLSYKVGDDYIGILEACLHSVSVSDNYIIAVQRPAYGIEPDSSMFRYFIVPIKEEFTFYPEEGIVGPLTQKACLDSAASLGIEKIKWEEY